MKPGLLFICLMAVSASAAEPGLRETINARSERVLLDKATALGQAEAQAKSRSEYGLELRPHLTESEAGMALRIYLPDRWSKDKLREQLDLVAESERLRVAALEWRELMEVYRDFCTYRMLRKQWALFDQEIQTLEPRLAEADQSVALHQLMVPDRAKLYSHCLGLVNDREKVKASLVEVEQRLRLALGYDADLERFSDYAVVEMPSQMELEALLQLALGQRVDYRQFDVEARSMGAAEAVAHSEEGFRFKYIQPFFNMDYDGGQNTVGISAAFVMPWGTRNPDIVVYQRQYALSLATKDLQRITIEHRLRVLLKTAADCLALSNNRDRTLAPLLKQLSSDLEQMDTGRLEQLRERLSIRARIFDASLQTTEATCRMERIAVDLAEELGSLE